MSDIHVIKINGILPNKEVSKVLKEVFNNGERSLPLSEFPDSGDFFRVFIGDPGFPPFNKKDMFNFIKSHTSDPWQRQRISVIQSNNDRLYKESLVKATTSIELDSDIKTDAILSFIFNGLTKELKEDLDSKVLTALTMWQSNARSLINFLSYQIPKLIDNGQ